MGAQMAGGGAIDQMDFPGALNPSMANSYGGYSGQQPQYQGYGGSGGIGNQQVSSAMQLQKSPQFLDSIILKVADVFANSTNQLRAQIVTQIFQKCSRQIEAYLTNKEVFLKRIEHNLVSNDPQARILSLKILSFLPSFLITRLNVQHLILHILTTSQDKQERQIATKTIQAVSSGSDLFAKSIMNQIKVRIVSGYFEDKTCANLIAATSKVPGDSISSMALFETLTSVYDGTSDMIRPALVRAMLRKTLRSPIIFETVMDFMIEAQSFEGIQVLSRKFPFSEAHFVKIRNLYTLMCQEESLEIIQRAKTQIYMTLSNQTYLFGTDYSNGFTMGNEVPPLPTLNHLVHQYWLKPTSIYVQVTILQLIKLCR